MPETDELIKELSAETFKSLKKVLSSRGRLQGNFYFTGDTKGKTAGLIVTLTARDPKGSKAINKGKKLRKAITSSKFARGIVMGRGAKLFFELHSGTANPSHMKIGFKKAFTDDALKSLKSLLRKAVIGKPEKDTDESAEEPEVVDDNEEEEEEDSVLTVQERIELAELIALQGDLSERNSELQRSLLSVEDAQQEQEELLKELNSEITRLESSTPVDEEALQAHRTALAEASTTGITPFFDVSSELPQDISNLLSLTTQLDLSQPATPAPDQDWRAAFDGYRTAMTAVDNQLEALRSALAASGDRELLRIGEYGLETLTSRYKEPLSTALLVAEHAAEPTAALRQIRDLATAFTAHLDADAAVMVTDNNPFGVAISLRSTLSPALRTLIQVGGR